jgi:transposase
MKGNLDVTQQMMAEPISESTIGLDLGDRWSRYCVIDDKGSVVKEDRVRTSPEALEATFRVILPSRIVIEAGTHSPWVSRLLERLGHQVIVANARKVRLIYESNRKNDRIDAQMLAKLGRVDMSLLSPVQHRSAEAQTDLAVVRSRDALVSAWVQLINAVRGQVKSMGGQLPASATSAFAEKVAALVPPGIASSAYAIAEKYPAFERTDPRLRPSGRRAGGEEISADQAAAAGERSGAADLSQLCAYTGKSGTFPEEPDGRQLFRTAAQGRPVREQFATVENHQGGRQFSAANADASGAIHSGATSSGQSVTALGLGTLPERGQEQ